MHSFRRRPIDINKKLPVVRSTKELNWEEDFGTNKDGTAVAQSMEAFVDEDTIEAKDGGDKTKTTVKEIPVPLASETARIAGQEKWVRGESYYTHKTMPSPDEEVEYFLDPEAWVALRDLNNGAFKEAPIAEEAFELVLDQLDKDAARTEQREELKPHRAYSAA
ncbi:hypothetical protein T492DRAFT_845295 [Pavlovales sp. CCMP2436]|nr:hypothetical protein T492DRAFT_845295 [Pavlovales sp. CCMP2436]